MNSSPDDPSPKSSQKGLAYPNCADFVQLTPSLADPGELLASDVDGGGCLVVTKEGGICYIPHVRIYTNKDGDNFLVSVGRMKMKRVKRPESETEQSHETL